MLAKKKKRLSIPYLKSLLKKKITICYTLYNMRRYLLALAALLCVCACKSYQTIPVTLPDGFVVNARVADTPQKQERGLMFVKKLPENEGMIFVFDQDKAQTFWMKNTLIDLDMVFINAQKTVTGVAAEMPHSYTYTPDNEVAYAQGQGQYVLELAAQTAAKHGVMPGTQLDFTYEK